MLVRAYKVTNTANGKAYIGITSASVKHRWCRHLYDAKRGRQVLLAAAIREFGGDVFRVEELCGAQGRKAAALLERKLIKEHVTMFPDGYNMTSGGEMNIGFTLSEVVREKQRQGRLGKKQPESAKRLISAAKMGVKLSAETRAKMSASHTGLRQSEKHRAALRAVQATPEYRAKMRVAGKKGGSRVHSPAEIAKQRASMLAFYTTHPEAKAKYRALANAQWANANSKARHLAGCHEWQANRVITPEERARRSAGARRMIARHRLSANTRSGVMS